MISASEVLPAVALTLNPLLVGILAWMLKRWIDRLEHTLIDFGRRQTECQLSLAKVYQTKVEADDDSLRQWAKLDDHSQRLARVETRLNDGRG